MKGTSEIILGDAKMFETCYNPLKAWDVNCSNLKKLGSEELLEMFMSSYSSEDFKKMLLHEQQRRRPVCFPKGDRIMKKMNKVVF